MSFRLVSSLQRLILYLVWKNMKRNQKPAQLTFAWRGPQYPSLADLVVEIIEFAKRECLRINLIILKEQEENVRMTLGSWNEWVNSRCIDTHECWYTHPACQSNSMDERIGSHHFVTIVTISVTHFVRDPHFQVGRDFDWCIIKTHSLILSLMCYHTYID